MRPIPIPTTPTIPMNVGFFVRHFTERGTEVAIYDYARYNEEILGNRSYIICFTEEGQKNVNFPPMRHSYNKFKERFIIIEIPDIPYMSYIINRYELSYFHTLTNGNGDDIYEFNNKDIWGNCISIKHCVFYTGYPQGDFYISISHELNKKYDSNIPVIPHIVDLPKTEENMRTELQIPENAIVYGRHGGMHEFNIDFVHEAIIEHIQQDETVYFLFLNTNKFYEHPRIIYLDMNLDLHYKVKFINTCNAMIHAKNQGETFGLSVAEFAINNKPIITCDCGDLEHIRYLGEKAIIYNSKEQLQDIFLNIDSILSSRTDWYAYTDCSPENVMNLFKEYIFDKKTDTTIQ